MREFPFKEIKLTENKVIRIFDAHNTTNSELIWHKDREDREVYIEESKDWHLQLENQIPVKLEAGQTHIIPAYTWHRLLMGKDKLIVEISKKDRKEKCKNPKGFTQKQRCKNLKTRSKKGERTNTGKIAKEGKDPKVGTGKKPKGSSRRLYTDENPKDTVRVKFSTVQDIRDTLSKASFKSKSHKRQSQIINLIHQRVRAAYRNAKDPKVKKRLKKAYDYATKRKEASKRKTKRLRKEQNEPFQKAVKKNYRKMKIRLIGKGGSNYVSAGMKKPSYARSKSAPPGFGGSLEEAAPQK